jgi:hypothetical protein
LPLGKGFSIAFETTLWLQKCLAACSWKWNHSEHSKLPSTWGLPPLRRSLGVTVL